MDDITLLVIVFSIEVYWGLDMSSKDSDVVLTSCQNDICIYGRSDDLFTHFNRIRVPGGADYGSPSPLTITFDTADKI